MRKFLAVKPAQDSVVSFCLVSSEASTILKTKIGKTPSLDELAVILQFKVFLNKFKAQTPSEQVFQLTRDRDLYSLMVNLAHQMWQQSHPPAAQKNSLET